MPKLVNPNLAKIHRTYTVEEAASLFGVHKGTVRNWIKSGLPLLDDRRPCLILGEDLRGFLQKKRQSRKRRCKRYEIYCLRCRAPKRPAADMVDYSRLSDSAGRLIGLCPDCNGVMNRYVNAATLAEIRVVLDVSIPTAQKHISKRSDPPVNSDFSKRT